MRNLHFWEFGCRSAIMLDRSYFTYIRNKILTSFNTWRAAWVGIKPDCSYSYFKDVFKPSSLKLLRSDILIQTCNILSISLIELESHIIAYGSVRHRKLITNPKLPLQIGPVFACLVAHHIGDGTVVKSRNRQPYFGYRQFSSQNMTLFVRKCQHVFGNVQLEYSDRTRTYLSSVMSAVFFSYYSMNEDSFLSETARVPRKVLDGTSEEKLAFLIGIIIDEGNVDSIITIRMKNKHFIADLFKLTKSLGYDCTTSYYPSTRMAQLFILKKSYAKLIFDYKTLIARYPCLGLGVKENKLMQSFYGVRDSGKYKTGNRERILKSIEDQHLSVNELARIHNMTRQGARYHVNKLFREGKIIVTYKIPGKPPTFVYGINT